MHSVFPIKLFLVALLGFVLSLSARAENTEFFEILSMSTGNDVRRLNIYPSIEYPNPAGCEENGWLQADETVENLDHIIAIAIPAFYSKTKISVQIDDSTCSAYGAPLVTQMRIGEI